MQRCIIKGNPHDHNFQLFQLYDLDSNELNNTKKAGIDIIFFNRAPKSGSETLVELMTRLGKIHNFPVVRYKADRKSMIPMQPIKNQKDYAQLIINLGSPSVYFQHLNWINFTQFGLPRPIYINMVRDPLERVISWFYFQRAPHIIVAGKKKNKNVKFAEESFLKKDYAECVLKKDRECLYIIDKNLSHGGVYNRQTIFYCGHDRFSCTFWNNEIPLQIAKRRVEEEYAVVGTWDDLNITLNVFENYIPKFFAGAKEAYFQGKKTAKTNVNTFKPKISEELKAVIRKNFTKEYEFYYFCRQRLHKQYLALKLEKNESHL